MIHAGRELVNAVDNVAPISYIVGIKIWTIMMTGARLGREF